VPIEVENDHVLKTVLTS